MGNQSSGRGALPLAVASQVTRLLSLGLKRNQVARLAHVDWKTVDRIAHGRHILQSRVPEYHRCRGCGGLVLLPCHLCRVRALREAGLVRRFPSEQATASERLSA